MLCTRRFFLRTTGAATAYLGFAPLASLGALAEEDLVPTPVRGKKTLVVLFLRGGADGLNLVVPFKDPGYAALRPSLRVPAPGVGDGTAIDLDGFFGLHPRLRPLVPFFESGVGRALHAVGYANNTRSHFEEQDVWETGIIGNTINSDGWLNRHLATSTGEGSLRAVAIGDTLPRILQGEMPAYALRGIEDLKLSTHRGVDPDAVAAALEHAYCEPKKAGKSAARDLLERTTSATLSGIEELRHLTGSPYTPKVQYPDTLLGRRLMQVARLIKADVGLEVAEVDFGGWDTHRNQGRGAYGQLANLAGQLAGSVAAFLNDLEDRLDDVVLVTLTDFGRTAAENGSGGTDHGWGNCLFVFGGPVRAAVTEPAGKVLGRWPGLAKDQLHQGRDLLHTTDFRDILGELVTGHLGNPNLKTVLPGHEFRRVGIVG